MRFEIIEKPFAIIIRNFFSKEINNKILNEAVSNRGFFTDAKTGKGLDKKFRSNIVAYYDEIYKGRRTESILLESLKQKFQNDQQFREILGSSPPPICDFILTNYDETQVSRYGNSKQKYDWHVDRFANTNRHVTVVYYFFKEPKRFKGGELSLTTSPIYDGKKVSNSKDVKIIPDNNMAVVFGSTIPHCVHPTTSTKKFVEGRFSVNCWVGFK